MKVVLSLLARGRGSQAAAAELTMSGIFGRLLPIRMRLYDLWRTAPFAVDCYHQFVFSN